MAGFEPATLSLATTRATCCATSAGAGLGVDTPLPLDRSNYSSGLSPRIGHPVLSSGYARSLAGRFTYRLVHARGL